MGWILNYFKTMWNDGANQGKQLKERDKDKAKKIIKKVKREK